MRAYIVFLRAFRIFKRLFTILDAELFWQDLTVAENVYRSTNLDRPGDFFEALTLVLKKINAHLKKINAHLSHGCLFSLFILFF